MVKREYAHPALKLERLSVRGPGPVVARLTRRKDGGIDVEACDEALRKEVQAIVDNDLAEWVPDGQGGSRQRVTSASDPTFLQRLGEDLARQFRFQCDVEEIDV